MSDLETLEQAVRDVSRAVKEKGTTAQYIVWGLVGVYLWTVPGQIWHAKWRYALAYNLSSDKITTNDKPHDCAFLAAPLGEKYCHYERIVSTVHWATSTAGYPIASYDDGKTWNTFTPEPNAAIPRDSTVEEVYISWQKKDD